ncbi:MAG: type IV secretory system conjugative DNA transfer family protein [Bifidobacteriaceae bacterium]|jgi:type IV secretory pathway TraG/TraD family ATPase VirD4|nr:type IV secretory system conjugative DNA transfer family protein [Bifidobacteriaceae bacterium]
MIKPSNEQKVTNKFDKIVGYLVFLFFLLVCLIISWSTQIGYKVDKIGLPNIAKTDLFTLFFLIVQGKVKIPRGGYIIMGLIGLIILALIATIIFLRNKLKSKSIRGDKKARFLGQGLEIENLSKKHALEISNKITNNFNIPAGQLLGSTVIKNKEVFMTWEDTALIIAGPRTGKTTSVVVPFICTAPGAAVVTSNKADVLNITYKYRKSIQKNNIWVFDPQGKTNFSSNWFWNPLSYILSNPEKSIDRAGEVASNFLYGSGSTSSEEIWSQWAINLIQCYLLAAAIDNRPISDLLQWVNQPDNIDSAKILKNYSPKITTQKSSFKNLANKIIQFATYPAEQQAGIFGTAQSALRFLESPRILPWIQKMSSGDNRIEFSPKNFAKSKGTIYLISQEGPGTAAPIITSFVNAIANFAVDIAEQNVGENVPPAQIGRLKTPMCFILDEAANICKWKELPNLYSHFGSRSICVTTILQSYAQGVKVWGEKEMETLFDASNIFIYGGGNKDPKNLESISKLLGERDRIMQSVTDSSKNQSISESISREYIFPPSMLAALPKERSIIITTGSVPTIIKKNFYWQNAEIVKKLKVKNV